MTQQLVNLPVPDRLNLDLSPSRLDPNEAADLYNVLLHEPGQLRVRKGYTRVASFTSQLTVPGQDAPVQIVTSPSLFAGGGGSLTPTRGLATFLTGQNGAIPYYRLGNPAAVAPAGFAVTNISPVGVFINADNPAAVTVAAPQTSNVPAKMPFTQQTMYDNTAIWTSIAPINAADKNNNGYNAMRLIRWAGANTVQQGYFVTINAGSTSGTIWTNAGGTTPPAISLVGQFLTINLDAPPIHYNYLITSHVAGQSAFTISKPFGLGNSLVGSRVTTACGTWNHAIVDNAPPNCTCAIAHYDRIFVGRPRLVNAVGNYPVGDYPNAIAWSDIGEPEKWTDTNFIQISGNPSDAIMGFAHVGDNLAIFTRYNTYLMTGTDEDSFEVHLASSTIGCIDSRSITAWPSAPNQFLQSQDGVFFMSDRGMMYFNGYSMHEVTQDKPGHGIKTAYRSTGSYFAYDTPRSQQCTTILPHQDYVLMTAQDNHTNAPDDQDSYMYHIPTGAWTRWGGSQTYTQPFVYTKPGLHLNNRAMALTRTSLVDLSSVFESEFPSSIAQPWDQYYTTGGATATADVLATVQFKDFEFFNGDTGRLHQLFVEHNSGYYGASDPSMVGWNVNLSVDPGLDTVSAAGTLQPRWFGNVSESAGLYQRYFTTQFLAMNGGFPLEGSVFRIQFTTVGTSQTTHRPQSMKMFQIRPLVEKGRDGRIDNAVTS